MSSPRATHAVICGTLVGRFAPKGVDKKHPRVEGYVNINVTSAQANSSIWKQLSPFVLGHIDTQEEGGALTSVCLENLWQSSKVFPGDHDPTANMPNQAWYDRRRQYCNDPKPHRRIKGKKGIQPLYSWWKGQKLSYVEARKQIYIPLYVEYASKTTAYARMESMLEQGEKIHIIGFDGRPFTDLTLEVNNLHKPFGHELCLCMMLLGLTREVLGDEDVEYLGESQE